MSNTETIAKSPLAGLIGEWAGTTGNRFKPADSFETCDVKATMRWVAHDTVVLYEYAGAVFGGQPAEGAMFVAFDGESGEGSMAWVDSFHSAHGSMSKGKAASGELLNVSFTYGDPADAWTWHTVITLEGPDAITILGYNQYPPSRGGERYVAIETKLRRAAASR